MPSTFHATRLTFRAVLFSSLLIFGQVLTLTASSPTSLLISTTRLHKAVRSLSALTFLTLLWLGFTSLELADLVRVSSLSSQGDMSFTDDSSEWDSESKALLGTEGPERKKHETATTGEGDEGLVMFFCRTDVELGFGLALFTGWISYWRAAFFVLSTYGQFFTANVYLLKINYIVVLVTLVALSVQMLGFITLHAWRSGWDALHYGELLGARSGEWEENGSITLNDEEQGKM